MPSAPIDIGWLYREHGPEVLRYLARRCPQDAARDLFQETFLQVARQGERIERVTMPRAWLFGIARHVLARHCREQIDPSALDAVLIDASASQATPEDSRLAAMREAIGQLPEELRETLALRLEEELSYEEIAGVLQIPIGTVRSRLHHAVRRLRAALAQPEKSP